MYGWLWSYSVDAFALDVKEIYLGNSKLLTKLSEVCHEKTDSLASQ